MIFLCNLLKCAEYSGEKKQSNGSFSYFDFSNIAMSTQQTNDTLNLKNFQEDKRPAKTNDFCKDQYLNEKLNSLKSFDTLDKSFFTDKSEQSLNKQKENFEAFKIQVEDFKEKLRVFENEYFLSATLRNIKLDINKKNKAIIRNARLSIYALFKTLKRTKKYYFELIKNKIIASKTNLEYKEIYIAALDLIIKTIKYLIVETNYEHINLRYDYLLFKLVSYEKRLLAIMENIPLLLFLRMLRIVILYDPLLTFKEKKYLFRNFLVIEKNLKYFFEYKNTVCEKIKYQTNKIFIAIQESMLIAMGSSETIQESMLIAMENNEAIQESMLVTMGNNESKVSSTTIEEIDKA